MIPAFLKASYVDSGCELLERVKNLGQLRGLFILAQMRVNMA
jgi:hypothetical protein